MVKTRKKYGKNQKNVWEKLEKSKVKTRKSMVKTRKKCGKNQKKVW